MGSDSTIGATLICFMRKAQGIRVTGRNRDCGRGDDRGTRDVDEDVSVILCAKQTRQIRTPIGGVGTMATMKINDESKNIDITGSIENDDGRNTTIIVLAICWRDIIDNGRQKWTRFEW